MRWRFLALALIVVFSANANSWEAKSEEEALFLRRIADFWQEGEYQIVKGQIEEFLSEYPDSSFSQSLSSTLGDLYMREKNFKAALTQYARITDDQIVQRIFINRMQCLLELQWFATLADDCESFLKKEILEPEQKLRATYLLAIALYQQCMSAEDPDNLQRLAQRAQPYFQFLLDSELSNDVAAAFAHLCCILKDYPSASKVYLRLAEQGDREEMLFQAALLQAEFDKTLAMQTFDEIVRTGKNRSQDAVYNRLVLSYDSGRYEEVLSKKDAILAQIPKERQGAAHLFFGRSFLQLKKHSEALQELLLFAESANASDALRTALVDILETAYQLGDEPSLKKALNRLSELFPDDSQLPKGALAHAMLLKKSDRLEEARDELEMICKRFASSDEIETAIFEALHLEFQQSHWKECSLHCREYLKRFSKSDLTPYVQRFLASASSHLANESTDIHLKEDLAADLESLLHNDAALANHEYSDWSFLLAKTQYELKRFQPAIELLQTLSSDDSFPDHANVLLLLSLCYRDGLNDMARFCDTAEAALALHANLLDEGSLHTALFNGYLALNQDAVIERAADHLYLASQTISIQSENLLWLADYYYGKCMQGAEQRLLPRALEAMQKFLVATKVDIHTLDENSFFLESAIVKLAEMHGLLGHSAEQIQLLESLQRQRESHPSWAWQEESKINLMLAENYAKEGRQDQALVLFDRVAMKNPTVRTFASASASLQSARLRIAKHFHKKLLSDHPDVQKVLAQLKTLMLQKTLANEPIHLEAAMEYIDLMVRLETKPTQIEKRLSLLIKTKNEFEKTDDLLSRDYQKSRRILPDKNSIVQAYLRLIDAEIALCQSLLAQDTSERKVWQKTAKQLFQEIQKDKSTSYLENRARGLLKRLEDRSQ